MRWNSGIWVLGLGLAACSGRYEVGGMDAGGTTNSGGSNAAGTTADGSGAMATAGTLAGGAAPGGTGNAGPSTPVGECVPLGMPKALTGEFATPAVVWSRISPLIWGEQLPAPANLPEKTTPAWAGQIVTQGFMEATISLPFAAQGARKFVAQLLDPGSDLTSPPEFRGRWELVLAADTPALSTLLNSSLGAEERLGVFTEPSFLSHYTTISRRGRVISSALFVTPPPPPANVPKPMPDPMVPEREALAMHIANPACASCHSIFDPMAYPLGIFDAMGDYRELDHGQPIDTSGTLRYSNVDVTFTDLADFNAQVSSLCEAHLGLADSFLHFALIMNGVPESDRDSAFQANYERIRQAFYRGGRSYPDLVRAYAQSPLGLRP